MAKPSSLGQGCQACGVTTSSLLVPALAWGWLAVARQMRLGRWGWHQAFPFLAITKIKFRMAQGHIGTAVGTALQMKTWPAVYQVLWVPVLTVGLEATGNTAP